MGSRFLVTGGAGFIGSHLTERLLADGHEVTVLDDLTTGRMGNLSGVATQPKLQIIRDSVASERTVDAAMANCDAVFHLASAVGVKLIVDQPVQTISTIIRGTETVLESAYRYNRPTLITSSSEVYGKGTRVPFAEDDDVLMGSTQHTRWCYAYAKGIDEFLGLAYQRQFGLPVTIVRLFNTVGPRQVGMYGMVLPRFVQAALAGDPLMVYGDGKQSRCFCHVSDVVDALVRLMQTPTARGTVFNLGSDEETTIEELAARVIKLANSPSGIERLSYEEAYGQHFDDLPRRVPKLDRIKDAIGFAPRHTLDAIIQSVIDEHRRVV
ncbi:MAG: dTDP-glucose 4,6-dehydratase [Phycisphaerales bacterium]|nr:dTDP-glucose 4,6-dehydratase [Phycisphaerales bacterium]